MAGLIEEGEEVMSEGKHKEDASADLALISSVTFHGGRWSLVACPKPPESG
jgi:hypothetical protein